MKAVEDGLKLVPSPLRALFVEEENVFFGRTYYTGLIWALETLAWKSEHLGRATDLLAGLIPLDPIKKQTNRTLDSLYHILQPWVQNCNSTIEDRLRLMEGLRKRRPREAYNLFIEMMPNHRRMSWHHTHVPRWRDWPAERRNFYKGEEVNEVLSRTGTWLVEDTANDPDRCVQLCGCLGRASRPFFEESMKHLSEVDLSNWSGEQRMVVWDKLRNLHTHHTTYRKQPDSMPQDLLRLLEVQMKRYEPLDPQLRYRWLFAGSHRLPVANADAYEEVQNRLTAEGAQAVLEHSGLEGVQSMVRASDSVGLLGSACGRIPLTEVVEFSMLDWSVGQVDIKIGWFGQALVSSLHRRKGWSWTDHIMSTKEWLRWPNEKKAEFLASLPFEQATWGRVASLGAAMESAYWKTCMPRGSMEAEQFLIAAQRFLDHGKPLRALTVIVRHGRRESTDAPTELLTRILEACIRTYTEEQKEVQTPDYTITEAHKLLSTRADADHQRMALIEWQFFGLLERSELVLYTEMTKDPSPFADILSFMNKPVHDPERVPTEQESRLAMRAYEVLKGWKGVPALNDDGTISEEGLETWYRKAVAAVAEKGRMWSDYPFGEKLRYAPADPGGSWPCLAVRSLIEKLQSDTLERGIEIEVYNSRGVSSADGGHSERVLSKRYADFAKAVEFTHPRTAAMLRRIADDYTSSACFWETRRETELAVDYHMG
jgi:hypothetical protein